MEVSHLKRIHVKYFVCYHVNLLLLQIRQLSIEIDHLFCFYLFGNLLPFFFELKTLIIVLDTPLFSTFINLFLCWFSYLSLITLGILS